MQDDALSDGQLILLAGEAAFGRGVAYYQQGMVVDWHLSNTTVTATVEGSETYHVKLKLLKRGLEGSCDCPASEGIDFCKHCVAVALAYRSDRAEQQRLAQGNDSERIRGYLEQLDKTSLIDNLASLIDSDPYLHQRWLLRADSALGTLDHKALKKRITAALPLKRELYRYSQVKAYFANAEPTIETLTEQLPSLSPEKSLTLIDYALSRLSRVLESIDDSGGFRFPIEQQLQELHVQTLKQLAWPVDKQAKYLYDIISSGQEDTYAAIPSAYNDVLGEDGLAAYNALLQAELDKLPPLPANATWDTEYRYIRLTMPLMDHAKERRDIDAMLALYAKTASKPLDCLRAAQACVELGAWEHLPEWIERLRRLPKPQHQRFQIERQRLEIQLNLHQSKIEAAAKQLWALYQHTFCLDDYKWLCDIADAYQLEEDYRQQVTRWLKEQLITPKANGASTKAYAHVRYANCLLEIYLNEDDLPQALMLCETYQVDPSLLYQVARKAPPQASLPLYRRLAESHIQVTQNSHYQQAVKLLKELKGRLTTDAQHEAFTQLLNDLAHDFKAKRNFIKYLKEAFPQ